MSLTQDEPASSLLCCCNRLDGLWWVCSVTAERVCWLCLAPQAQIVKEFLSFEVQRLENKTMHLESTTSRVKGCFYLNAGWIVKSVFWSGVMQVFSTRCTDYITKSVCCNHPFTRLYTDIFVYTHFNLDILLFMQRRPFFYFICTF